MSDNKSRDIFYGVVAVATLIIALIGATLAYFSITANSAENAVKAQAAIVSIEYEDGQNVLAQANNLIPVTFDILKTLYEDNLDEITAQYNTPEDSLPYADRQNLCKDGKSESTYDVCSVFRFKVKNDRQTTIRAMLRTDDNKFRDLYYAVRVVKGGNDADPSAPFRTGDWIKVNFNDNGDPLEYSKLSSCDETEGNECYTVVSNARDYKAKATNPIFGYVSANDSTFKTLNLANNEYVFDVVLFILDDEVTNQNYDQGKTYAGNIYIETTGGSDKITGQLS